MKTRYNESFLFPQGQNDFGRSLVFPQGTLRGLGGTTEQQNLTYGFVFPQGETDDYGRALMFPQGQLHGLRGLGAAPTEAEIRSSGASWGLDPDDPSLRNLIITEIEKRAVQKAADDAYDAYIAARNAAAPAALAILQYDSTGRATDTSIQAANAFQAQQAAPQEAAFVAAQQKVEAVVQANYAAAAAIPNTIEEIVARAREDASITAKNEGYDLNAQNAAADAAEMSARRGDSYGNVMRAGSAAAYAAKSRADAIAAQEASIAAGVAQAAAAAKAAAAAQAAAAEQMASGVKAAQAATAAQAAAATTASTPKTIVSVNNTAGTVTSTTPATGTVTTTSPTTGATTTANVFTGAVTVTTPSGQTVAGAGSVTAGETSTTVNIATQTVTTTNTKTGATTITDAATGQTQTGTAKPTTYLLDFHDNQFWLTTSAGVEISHGSFDWKTPAAYLAGAGITLAQTTLTPAASVQFAKNQGVTTQVTTTGGTTTTNPTTGTVTKTNPVTGTVTTTNTTTGTTHTTTPATGTTTVTTSPATDTGKLALFALLGVLLLRGAVR
jgi:hypothetical protein